MKSRILTMLPMFLVVLCASWFSLNPVQAHAETFVLTWNANTETDLAGYRVYRSLDAAACANTSTPLPGGPIANLGKVTTYTDTTVTILAGTVCYELSAFDTQVSGNESGRGNRVTKVIINLPPLAPSGLSVATQ